MFLFALIGAVTLSFAPRAFSAVSDGAITVSTGKDGQSVSCWLATSLTRIFPHTKPGSTNLTLMAARNSRIAFQICFQSQQLTELTAQCKLDGADDLSPTIRYVGFVPVHHFTSNTKLSELDGLSELPGLAPDPLWPLSSVHSIGPAESRSFWITLNIPADAKPGPRSFDARLRLNGGKQTVSLPVKLRIANLVVQPRHDFPVTHWWRGEATWDYYHTGMFDERWWTITRAQLADMLDHGSDVIYVPLLFNRRETFKRPCQLLEVNEPSPGKYEFNWDRVKRFIDMSRSVGFKKFEWPHLWIYWGVKHPMRIYTLKAGKYEMLWDPEISGFSDTYLNFLKQFLPEFHSFLAREGLLENSYFHLSDEPSGEAIADYKHARQILRELAPWMKVMDALSDIRYGRQGITDMPVPKVSSAQAYVDAGIPHWVYFCCSPKGPWLNRFMDTPLPKIRMAGFLFYHQRARGFLHWGYNYWHKIEQEKITDPFTDGCASAWPGIPYGDPFEIYPGPDGKPIDSIRWEVFAEALQDYAILQTAGIKPEDPILKELKSYADFPKTEQWIDQTLDTILRQPK